MMDRLYRKNGIYFAISWIVIYVVGLSFADNLSVMIGMEKSITVVVCLLLTVILAGWMKKNAYLQKYGLCRPTVASAQMLYYIPLAVMISVNLWFGITMNLSPAKTIFYMVSMLFVGFLEEIIFRGLLFVEMCKDNVKTAVVVSSVTFGIGHIVNLFNGSEVDLFSNLLQVVYAIAAGFLFTIIFMRTKSLWPCIITHSVLNALSIFSNESAMTPAKELIGAIALMIIPMVYSWYILRNWDVEKKSISDRKE